MTNIFNTRVQKLIKDDLLEYGKQLLCFIGLGLLFGLGIPLLINLFFGIQTGVLDIQIEDLDVGLNFAVIFSFITAGFFAVTIFTAGIVAGYELPQHVRKGIARKEYFISTVTAGIIVILAIFPSLLFLNMAVNLFSGSENIFYNLFNMGWGNIANLISHLLMYMTLFSLGYFVAVYWQRVGWLIALASIIGTLIVLGFLGWNIPTIPDAPFIGFSFHSEYGFSIEGFVFNFSNNSFVISTITMIGILSASTYAMVRNVTVKTR